MIIGGSNIPGGSSTLSDKEIIKAIISESSKYIKSFTRNGVDIHSFFFELTKDNNYKDFFSDLMFDTNGPYPYSEELDDILSLLHFSGIIGSINPILKNYTINISDKYFDTISKSLGPKDTEKLKQLAERFSNELGKKPFPK